MTKLKNKTQKQNSKTQIVTKLKTLKFGPNLKYDKSQFMKTKKLLKGLLVKYFDTLTTDLMFSGQRFAIPAMFFFGGGTM